MDTLAQRLSRAIAYARLTQQEVADRSGVQQKTISKLVTGKQRHSTKIVELAHALGIDPTWLATGQGEMLVKPSILAIDNEGEIVKITNSAHNNVMLAVWCIGIVRRYLLDTGRTAPDEKIYALAEKIFNLVKVMEDKRTAMEEVRKWLDLAFI